MSNTTRPAPQIDLLSCLPQQVVDVTHALDNVRCLLRVAATRNVDVAEALAIVHTTQEDLCRLFAACDRIIGLD